MSARLIPLVVLVLGVGVCLAATPLMAQISPGKLSKSHATLEGNTQCLKCHEAGKGVSTEKCFACHRLLQERVAAGKGLHARTDYRDCKICHVEHQGVEPDLVWWGKAGKAAFDHKQTGYALEGKHGGLDCAACHQAKFNRKKDRLADGGANAVRTFLGLGSACLPCHAEEHRGQFRGRDCLACHGLSGWKPAPGFDHARTSYPLTGRHAVAACAKCHPAQADAAAPGSPHRKFEGIAARECTSCHQDVHRGRFGPTCTSCHNTAGWKRTDRASFDHNKTSYPLRAKHATVVCDKCHTPGKPMKLPFERCTNCHADTHLGQFARRADQGRCESCHDLAGFTPAKFAVDEHQKTSYVLAGAHLAVPCNGCHRLVGTEALRRVPGLRPAGTARAAQFRFASARCLDCHRDLHLGEMDRYVKAGGCESCHGVESWRKVTFDHAKTKFALNGGHAKPACSACHKQVDPGTPRARIRLAGLALTCESCHQDTHQGQFAKGGVAAACDRCHTTENLRAAKFDHNRDSLYALDGAHARVPCAACHRTETKGAAAFVRYKPLPTTCKGCHGNSTPSGKEGAS